MNFSPIRRLSRRHFMSAAGAAGLGAFGVPPVFQQALAASDATTDAADRAALDREGRILVVVELTGGNDGLNTVVPYGDDAYYNARPRIGIPAGDLRTIDDHFGFHPSCKGLAELYDRGELAIVHGCGYDQPSFSHFISMSYWHSAAPNSGEASGWVGRAAANLSPTPRRDYIINVDERPSQAVRNPVHPALVFDQPETFRRDGVYEQQPMFDELIGDPGASESNLAFLSRSARDARQSAMLVREAWNAYQSDVDYGINIGLAQDLRKIVSLIDARMPARFYYCGYRGNSFDTHVHQADVHARLLAYATDAIRGFVDDVERIGRSDDVLMLVFTEFGRRVPENISLGTDHGTATPVFLAGAPVAGGQYGTPPSLTELDDGNLLHTTDFRRVYASAVGNWMGADPGAVLGGDFEPIPAVATA